MSEIKPWQIIIIVVAVVVLAFSGWRMMGSSIEKGPTGYMTVDVITGQLYLLKKGKAKGLLLPALNPDTKQRTLYPVNREENSEEWTLDIGYAEFMPESIREESDILGNKYEIKILDTDPIVHVIMK